MMHYTKPKINLAAQSKTPGGFTIVELMVATTVFAIVLLVFLSAFLQVGRLFYKGINSSNTQEAARTILQDISDDINFSNSTPQANNISSGYFCIGLHEYKFMLGNQIGGHNPNPYDINSNYGIVRQNIGGGCPVPASCTAGSNCEELLGTGMQLNNLAIGPLPAGCNGSLCTIKIRIVFYGGDPAGLFKSTSGYVPVEKAPDAECTGQLASTQYCVTANYSSTVLQSF